MSNPEVIVAHTVIPWTMMLETWKHIKQFDLFEQLGVREDNFISIRFDQLKVFDIPYTDEKKSPRTVFFV